MKKLQAFIFLFCCSLSAGAQDSGFLDQVTPFIMGEIHELRSEVLGENRILNIYLPEGYHPKDSQEYPVIYLLDGSADEDFIHIAGLVQYHSFEWIDIVPKSIVVGIATVDRRRDFTFPTTIESDLISYPTTGHSEKFIAFLENELQPYIEEKFKTSESRTLILEKKIDLFLRDRILLMNIISENNEFIVLDET